MKKPFVPSSLILMLFLIACTSLAQPTPFMVASATLPAVPAWTVTHSAITTPLPSTTARAVPTVSIPQGQPASEWNGIPIMPGAIVGEGDLESYVFSVRATPEKIKEFYRAELSKLGWQRLDTGDQVPARLLFVNGSSETLTVNILTKGDEALVLLVK